MHSQFKISWSKVAEMDLESIVDFISEESPLMAFRILDKVHKTAISLKKSPFRGRVLPEFKNVRGLPFRELLIKPWRLIYKIDNKEVHIVAFLDSRRDLEELLYERLIRGRTK